MIKVKCLMCGKKRTAIMDRLVNRLGWRFNQVGSSFTNVRCGKCFAKKPKVTS